MESLTTGPELENSQGLKRTRRKSVEIEAHDPACVKTHRLF